ncbi:MAG: hypothetical protein ACRDTP_01035 [Mycobacteriales bacterium]
MTATTKKTTTGPTVTITLPPALSEAVKPFYSAVGAYDAAFAAARSLPATYQAEAKARRDAFATGVKELRGSVRAQVKELPATVKELRGTVETQARDLPTKAQARFTALQETYTAQLAHLQHVVQARVLAAPTTIKELRETVEAQARELPELALGLPAKAQAQIDDLQQQVEQAVDRLQKQATGAYTGYVKRGERLASGYVRTTPGRAPRKNAPRPAAEKKAAVRKPAPTTETAASAAVQDS